MKTSNKGRLIRERNKSKMKMGERFEIRKKRELSSEREDAQIRKIDTYLELEVKKIKSRALKER